MKKNKSASKPTSPISLLRGAIGQREKSKPLRVALEAFKEGGPIERFEMAYILASTSTQFSNVFPAARRIQNIGALGTALPLRTASLAREIQWAAIACYFSRIILKKFIPLRAEYFRLLVLANFSEAESKLDEICEICGESTWAVENRVALLSISSGFEAQKKYIQQITKERRRSYISFMATHFGERNEPRVSLAAFTERIRNRAAAWDIEDNQKNYIVYKLLNTVDNSEKGYATLLAHDGSCSCIDLYETLLDVIRRSKEKSFFSIPAAVAALEYLAELDDPRIEQLNRFVREREDSKISLPVGGSASSQSLFLLGQYDEARDRALEELKDVPADTRAIATYSKLCAMNRADVSSLAWFPKLVAENLSLVYSACTGAADAADALAKISVNFRHANFSQALVAPIAQRTFQGFDRRGSILESANVFQRLDSTQYDEENVKESPALIFERIASGVASDVDAALLATDSANYALMQARIANCDFDAALEFAKALERSEFNYFRIQGIYFAAHIMAKGLLLEAAIEQSVENYIKCPESIFLTPLVDIVRDRGFRDLKAMRSSPCLSAAFYIYIDRTEDTDKEVALKVAWKRYLQSKNVDRPSKIDWTNDATSADIVAFFLSEVCRQDTMELGEAFSSQLDLDRERMQICIELASLDPGRVDIYDHEIVDLTRRINIEEGVAYLESSRVFVDEIGVQKWARKNLESQFLRYIDYLKAGLFVSVKELEAEILKLVTTSKNRRAALASFLDDYDVSAETLLEEVLRELSQAFLLLPRFGMDAFLSSRIRHGSFVGYLRGPLETHHLITKKDSETGKYQVNDHILDKWGVTSLKERNNISARLASFSANVDSTLDEAVSKYLHVRSRSRPEGRIFFAAESGAGEYAVKRWLLTLKATLDENISLEELVSYCFKTFFWPAVKITLDDIQTYVRNELGNILLTAIDDLANSIAPSLDESKRGALLRDAYYARLDVKAAVERVSLWFDVPQNSAPGLTMSLRNAIEIGLISTKNARPKFEPSVSWHVDESANILLNGPAIGLINDIAFLIFENISKHSGFEELAEESIGPEVDVSILLSGNAIRVLVGSQISERKQMEDVVRGIASAKEKIANRDFDSVTQSTNGTGLVRLAINAGMTNPEDGSSVDFGLDGESRFFVRFDVARGIVEAASAAEALA